MSFTDYLTTIRGPAAHLCPFTGLSEFCLLLLPALVVAACASGGGSGLTELKADQRHRIYKDCVAGQMRVAGFGSGAAVHRACLDWARRQI